MPTVTTTCCEPRPPATSFATPAADIVPASA